MNSLSNSKGSKHPLAERIEVGNNNSSQNILPYSLPKKMIENIKKIINANRKNNTKDKPKDRSAFVRMTTKKFLEVMRRLMKVYPDIFINEDENPNDSISSSLSYGAKGINELNKLVRECTALYSRSECIRMGIIIYHLMEMIGADSVEKNSVDTKSIKYVKINGKLCPILDLDDKIEI